ncbi:MAG: hypothetical protein AAGA31_09825 [Bacteroidota bacterium]
MQKFFTLLFFGLLTLTPLSGQCELTVETTEVTCDSLFGDFTFRLVITGTDSTVRLPEFGLEFPLPLEEDFRLPFPFFDTVALYFESGTAPDFCRDTVLLFPPEDCTYYTGSCSVQIIPEGLNCGSPTTLTAAPTGTPPFTYRWNTRDTTATINYTNLPHFDYAVTVTDADGCVSQTSRFFGEAAPFGIHIESSGAPCAGDPPALTALVTHGQSPFTYAWSTGDTTPTITGVVQEQFYQVTVTDGAGCSSSAVGLYHPGAFGQRLQITGPTSTNCDGTPITLSIQDPDPGFDYTWIQGTDTLFGAQITTSTGGHFTVVGTQRDNPSCQAFGNYFVAEVNYDVAQLAIANVSDPCDSTVCLAILNREDGSFLLGDFSVEWSSPNVDIFGFNDFGLLCVNEPGAYFATVTTPCDTIELVTQIKSIESCTDLCGTVIMDVDEDCIPDSQEANWQQLGLIITNDSTNISYLIWPNADGSFCGVVPEGSYNLQTTGDDMMISTDCAEQRTTMEVRQNTLPDMQLFARIPSAGNDEVTTSIGALEAATEISLKVFPNPTYGSIQIDPGTGVLAPTDVVSLYDGLGRLIEQTTVAALPIPWRPRSSKSGIHHLVLTDRNGGLKARSSVVFR